MVDTDNDGATGRIGREALFERVTWSVFIAGLSGAVLARKWPAIREALGGFEPRRVAAWGAVDVAGYLESPAVVRNERKILDTVTNARRLLRLEREHGSISAYLSGLGDLGATGAASHLQVTFAGLGERTSLHLARALGVPEESLLLRGSDPVAGAGIASLFRL